ncbi:MAG: serine/threonine protein kinase [Deltaproteobacteria bacterium]|nr:serine/threonine protein kinase [Deltaproteobacteria bacterium]
MALPRLRAEVGDARTIAKILRAALRHEVASVPLSTAPSLTSQHLLELDVPREGMVTLLAEPTGEPRGGDGYPLAIRPVTRPQMAEIFAMVERLDDEPSKTVPPPDGAEHDDDDGNDATLVQVQPPSSGEAGRYAEVPRPSFGPSFGKIEAEFGPPSSGRAAPKPPPPKRRISTSLPAFRPPTVPPSSGSPGVTAGALIGRVIAGKYKLESTLGQGVSAVVFKARHLDLKRNVAVKILHEQKLDDPQFVGRFKAEALAASKLEHPNVARVLDFGQEPDGVLYLVMELLEGRTLEAILAAGILPQRIAVTFAIQACSALAFAHDVGIFHRDVKPENIMIVPHRDDDGNPCDLAKVCDFGLAKLRDKDGDQEDLTQVGMLFGSPAYMAPEQTRGETVDERADIYSLAVTLFQAVTGGFPHEAETLVGLFSAKLMQPPRKISALLPNADPLLEDVLDRALAADPRSRHPNVRVLREELREVLKQLEDDVEEHERTIVAD